VNCGIYRIVNKENNNSYIGQSVSLKNRKYFHFRNLEVGRHKNKHLQSAYNKYGKENFIYYIILECPIEKLNDMEIYYIKELHSNKSEWGYNITWGGDGTRGVSPSEETRQLMRLAKLGGHASDETRALLSAIKMGHGCSDETRKKLRDKKLGTTVSEETKKKIREKLTGTILPVEIRKKISDTLFRIARYGKDNPLFGKKPKNTLSNYYCVSRAITKDKRYGREYIYWDVAIREKKGKIIRLRSFKKEEMAARAYDKYVVEHNLERPLNFPEEYGR
jgi:group I intron endonuclease